MDEQTDSLGEIIRALAYNLEFMRECGVPYVGYSRQDEGAPDGGADSAGQTAPGGYGQAGKSSAGTDACGPVSHPSEDGALNPASRLIFFIGEDDGHGPDADPFSGEKGELLARMIKAMGLSPGEVCVTCKAADLNDVKGSSVVVAMGPGACEALFREPNVKALRGRYRKHSGALVMPTYSPRELLVDESLKKDAWGDLQMVMEELGLKR